jgi:hypothetical protein
MAGNRVEQLRGIFGRGRQTVFSKEPCFSCDADIKPDLAYACSAATCSACWLPPAYNLNCLDYILGLHCDTPHRHPCSSPGLLNIWICDPARLRHMCHQCPAARYEPLVGLALSCHKQGNLSCLASYGPSLTGLRLLANCDGFPLWQVRSHLPVPLPLRPAMLAYLALLSLLGAASAVTECTAAAASRIIQIDDKLLLSANSTVVWILLRLPLP